MVCCLPLSVYIIIGQSSACTRSESLSHPSMECLGFTICNWEKGCVGISLLDCLSLLFPCPFPRKPLSTHAIPMMFSCYTAENACPEPCFPYYNSIVQVCENMSRCLSCALPLLLIECVYCHYYPCPFISYEILGYWLRTHMVTQSTRVQFPLPPWLCV